MRVLLYVFLCVGITVLPSCALLDKTISVFDEDSGEMVEVAVGDVIADSAPAAEGVVSTLLGANPALAAVGGAAAAALFGNARRKKKAAAPAAAEPEAKA